MTKLEIKTTWRAWACILIIALIVALSITYLLANSSSREGFTLYMTALAIGYVVLISTWIIKYWPGNLVRFDQNGILIRKRSLFGKEEGHLYRWKSIARIEEWNGRMKIIKTIPNREVTIDLKKEYGCSIYYVNDTPKYSFIKDKYRNALEQVCKENHVPLKRGEETRVWG